MNCEEIREQLEARLDGELDAAVELEVERHLRECGGCREELGAMEALAAAARALPRGVEPDRDLWPGVEARIRTVPDRVEGATPWWAGRMVWLAATAALLLLVGVPLTGILEREWHIAPAPESASVARETVGAEGAALRVAAQAGLARREDGTQHSRTDLEVSVERQRDVLSEAVVADLEENLRLLEIAVAELRTALEEDPWNRRLSHLLAARYQQEAELAQRMNRI